MNRRKQQPESREVVPTSAGDLTKGRILDAAEALFAENGFSGVSMRDVGKAANVPYALTTYHFKTKVGLYRAIFGRRAEDLAAVRLKLIQSIEITGDLSHDIRLIASVTVEPLILLRDSPAGRLFTTILGRELYDPCEAERGILKEFLDPTASKLLDLLRRVLPDISYEKICWAFYFATGALAINHTNSARLQRLCRGRCKLPTTKQLSAELTTFIAAGWLGVFTTEEP